MKKKYIYKTFNVLLVTLFMLNISCENLLEETPETFLSEANFYNTESDAIAAVNGIYQRLTSDRDLYPRLIPVIFTIPDDITYGRVRTDFDFYSLSPENNFISGFYNQTWKCINDCNTAIAKIPEIEGNKNVLNRLVGEAKFIRALMYFYLVRGFGGVPVLTKPSTGGDDFNVSRNTVDEVYAQIIKDLQEAEPDLWDSYSGNDLGRPTKYSALALLGKVFLQQKDWDNAETKLAEVINSNQFKLLPDFKDLWFFTNDYHEERVFAINHTRDVNPSFTYSFFGSRETGVRNPYGGWGQANPEEEFVNSWDTTDYRYQWTIRDKDINGNPLEQRFLLPVHKYTVVIGDNYTVFNNSSLDYPVIRYADVILMYAEALNEQNRVEEARSYINMIRERARGGLNGEENRPNPADIPSGLSKSEMAQVIMDERKWELAFEGHRWFDLVRKGKFAEVMAQQGKTVSNDYLWPIPQADIDANPNLEQNPGY